MPVTRLTYGPVLLAFNVEALPDLYGRIFTEKAMESSLSMTKRWCFPRVISVFCNTYNLYVQANWAGTGYFLSRDLSLGGPQTIEISRFTFSSERGDGQHQGAIPATPWPAPFSLCKRYMWTTAVLS